MNRKLKVLSKAAIISTIIASSFAGVASAKVDNVILVSKTNPQDVRQYNYSALNDSFASYKGDKSQAGLYQDFRNKILVDKAYKIYALHDDTSKIYADYEATNDALAEVKGKGETFNLNKYTSKTDSRFPNPTVVNMPGTITNVVANTANPAGAPIETQIPTPDVTTSDTIKFNAASIGIATTADTVTVDTVQVILTPNGLNGNIDLSDTTKYQDGHYIKNGSVTPSVSGSLTVTSIKNDKGEEKIQLLSGKTLTQSLTAGEPNTLDVITFLGELDSGKNGVSIGALRTLFGSVVIIEGTFNSTPVKLTVRLKGTTTN